MKKLFLIGLFQAIGVTIYVLLISSLLQFVDGFNPNSIFLVSVAILILLVFSSAVVGLIVFGYPIYLCLHKKIKESLFVLGFTLLFSLITIILILLIILL
ncbi:hypothetical protein KKA23_00405 [Patescibacteria group bacterium]|nr:hypothetical protein [Patescibacteria group bacterium]